MLPITRVGFNHFNSQPHKEADVDGRLKDDNLKTFQLTASQGG